MLDTTLKSTNNKGNYHLTTTKTTSYTTTYKKVKRKAFKVSNPINNIQVPSVTLFGGYAGIPVSKSKLYKPYLTTCISNLRIASMIPGDRKVAGCFNFSSNFGGFF